MSNAGAPDETRDDADRACVCTLTGDSLEALREGETVSFHCDDAVVEDGLRIDIELDETARP